MPAGTDAARPPSRLARVAWAVCGAGWSAHLLWRGHLLSTGALPPHDDAAGFDDILAGFAFAAAALAILATFLAALGHGCVATLGAVGICVLGFGRCCAVAASADETHDGLQLILLVALTVACIELSRSSRPPPGAP